MIIRNKLKVSEFLYLGGSMSKNLPAMDGYQPMIKTPQDLQTKGYQPQQQVANSTNTPKKSPRRNHNLVEKINE